MSDKRIYQVSTLQALSLGYTRAVVKVGELLAHGRTGLGTFEGVNGDVFGVDLEKGTVKLSKISLIEIQMPDEPAFDTYALREASAADIKAVEQG